MAIQTPLRSGYVSVCATALADAHNASARQSPIAAGRLIRKARPLAFIGLTSRRPPSRRARYGAARRAGEIPAHGARKRRRLQRARPRFAASRSMPALRPWSALVAFTSLLRPRSTLPEGPPSVLQASGCILVAASELYRRRRRR